nr:AlNc14C48G3848 [Albugo laibachii Nc14]CCA18418.1 AlNc14C50G3942 [Albugo laibachii Nc14]|eukprot:CCA18418.1 AlNc14C50G3942 [Albugo laibachii Nc14]
MRSEPDLSQRTFLSKNYLRVKHLLACDWRLIKVSVDYGKSKRYGNGVIADTFGG